MSYCRWSTVLPSGHESDLYIFDHVDGYISVMVAECRRFGIENAPRPLPFLDPGWSESRDARRKWVQENLKDEGLAPIDLPHAGKDFSFTDAASAVAFLKELRELGYNMPDHVLDVSIYEKY